ncbi:MAG TPA: hypothetical protein VER76_13270 [Pyrinomonadaceae bacterium]|nr:hypothetical protein [Pyrinomonadaceae bacterium]
MRDVLLNEDPLKNIGANPKAAAVISFFLVLPFALLDLLFNPSRRQNLLDPVVLFGLLWLLPMVFIFLLAPVVRSVRAGNNILANPVTLLFRVAFLVVIAWLWGVAIIDQLPCFVGVPNCD